MIIQWIKRNYTIFSILILVISALWTAWTAIDTPATTQGKIYTPAVGFMAPDIQLRDSMDNPIALTDFEGKIVVLNFWASWCPPCKAEMPALQDLQNQFPDDLVVLAVHMTSQDSLEAGKAFITAEGLKFAVGYDTQGQAARLYQIRSMPTTFFIDSQGEIKDIVLGGPLSIAQLKSRIEMIREDE